METILIVDDEKDVLNIVRAILERNNYTVFDATSAEAGVRVAEAHPGPIHLLITNHLVKGASGRDLAERMKSSRPEMKVLHISGHSMETLKQQGSLTPGSGFLQKPFGPRELEDKVREMLGKERAQSV